MSSCAGIGLPRLAEGLGHVVGPEPAREDRAAQPRLRVVDRLVDDVPGPQPTAVAAGDRPDVVLERDPKLRRRERSHPGWCRPVPDERVALHFHAVRLGEIDDPVRAREVEDAGRLLDRVPLHLPLGRDVVEVAPRGCRVGSRPIPGRSRRGPRPPACPTPPPHRAGAPRRCRALQERESQRAWPARSARCLPRTQLEEPPPEFPAFASRSAPENSPGESDTDGSVQPTVRSSQRWPLWKTCENSFWNELATPRARAPRSCRAGPAPSGLAAAVARPCRA